MYNKRLQMTSVSAGTLSLAFGYATANNSGNNGNRLQQTITPAGLRFSQNQRAAADRAQRHRRTRAVTLCPTPVSGVYIPLGLSR